MKASLQSFRERQLNAGVYLLNRSGWIILSTYVAGRGSRENDAAHKQLLDWCAECDFDTLPVHGQWDGVKESSVLIFTDDDVIDYAGLAETFQQDCLICPHGLVWNSGKVQPLTGSKSISPSCAGSGDYSTIDGEFFVFDFADKPKFDSASFVIAYEVGELCEEEIIEGFQELINSGLAWRLQGHYCRTAQQLIDSGDCELPEA